MNVVLNKEALSTQDIGNSIFSLNHILEILPCSWIQNSFQPARLSMIWPAYFSYSSATSTHLLIPLQPVASLLFLKHTKLLSTWGPLYFLFLCSYNTFPPVLSLTGHLVFVIHVSALMSLSESSSTMTLSQGATQSLYISSPWVIFIIMLSLPKLSD